MVGTARKRAPLPTLRVYSSGTCQLRRQRDEFLVVAGHGIKAGKFPIRFGLLDTLLARGNEIPPDMTRSVHGSAAQKHQARSAERLHRNGIAGTKYQQAAGRELVPRNVD